MVHQVRAYRGVQVHLKRNLQLRPNAVHTRDQNRIGVLGLVDGEQPAKAANLAQHTLGESLVRQILDPLLGAVGAVNVHAGIGVGNRRRAGCGSLGHRFLLCFYFLAWGSVLSAAAAIT